jgi:hypothetical protein
LFFVFSQSGKITPQEEHVAKKWALVHHPKEDLAKFGYMKCKTLIILSFFWLHIENQI